MGVLTGRFRNDPKPDFAVAIPNQNPTAICLNNTNQTASTIHVILSVAGPNNSFYTSEMTMTNRGTRPVEFPQCQAVETFNIFQTQASGTLHWYAKIIRAGGTNSFIAFAVINDGGAANKKKW